MSETPEERLQQQLDGRAQRTWSEGRIGPDDDGDIALAIGSDPDKELVIIDFGKEVTWLAMPPQQAVEIAQMLIKHARTISKSPLTINL